jgi:hypothetical protein
MVDPAGICPAGGNAPGRRLAVASHEGAGPVVLLGAEVTVLAPAGCGAPAVRGRISLGAGPTEHALTKATDTRASRLIGTP